MHGQKFPDLFVYCGHLTVFPNWGLVARSDAEDGTQVCYHFGPFSPWGSWEMPGGDVSPEPGPPGHEGISITLESCTNTFSMCTVTK